MEEPIQEKFYFALEPTMQESSAALMHTVRTTLTMAQDITSVVDEAERVADKTSKFCDSVETPAGHKRRTPRRVREPNQHAVADTLTKQIQHSVIWAQQLLDLVNIAESTEELVPGCNLRERQSGNQVAAS
mmetsp:Transcript_4885/g.10642  ORF Transcript_4885/g.10642 Transcript_4885/m.10642 type:complete len:131 (+) Transcript_4885:717-1109(+)